MKETKRTAKLFADLYNGDPWVGVNIKDTLQHISSLQAIKKVHPQWNSIWQITNHIINWRENVLKRIQGEVITTPTDNYMTSIYDPSEAAWKHTLERLEDSQKKWILFLQDCNKACFKEKYKDNDMSYYEHIHGIMQHDAYHLGQIVLLSKAC